MCKVSQNKDIDKKNCNCDLFITLLQSFLFSLDSGFGNLKVKLQSFFGDISVLKVFKLNTNDAIKF